MQEQKLASEVNESGFTVNTPSLHVFDGRRDGYIPASSREQVAGRVPN